MRKKLRRRLFPVHQAVGRIFVKSLAIDFDKPNVIASYKRKKKEEKQMQAYCVKCRAKKEIKDPKSITMKNGKPATQGVCPSCGTKMFRIGKA